jgi:hypothetical protein
MSAMTSPPGGDIPELGGVVQQIVTRLLPHGYPDVKSVAGMVRVSARTLQGRPSDEGLPSLTSSRGRAATSRSGCSMIPPGR